MGEVAAAAVSARARALRALLRALEAPHGRAVAAAATSAASAAPPAQRKLHACHGDTEAVLKADFKGQPVDEAALVASYMRLLRPCVDGHLAGLPAALERVKAGGAAPAAAKAKSSGWFA